MIVEYFRLMQDTRIPKTPFINDPNMAKLMREAFKGNYSLLKQSWVQTYKVYSPYNYPDVLDKQLFMVKKELLDAFSLLVPNLQHQTVYLLDRTHKDMTPYCIPNLPFVECLGKGSKYNMDRSVVSKTVLRRSAMGPHDIFQVAGVNTNLVILSLAATEAVLRCKPYGIRIQRIELED